jgi:DNA-binding response OmpR family regulator
MLNQPHSPSQKIPRILVIDDEESIFEVVEGLLYREGYELSYVSSGKEALEQIDDIQPDVILLDLMMPNMDGIQTCQRIKANDRWCHIPIIMVTALSSKQDLARSLDAGADDFLSKPINSLEMRARVRSMLRIKFQYDALDANQRLRTLNLFNAFLQ